MNRLAEGRYASPEPENALMRGIRRYVPPELREAGNRLRDAAAFGLNMLSPGADVRDFQDSTRGAITNALSGNYAQAGVDALGVPASLAAMALPGSVSGMKGMVRATDDAMGKAADALPAWLRKHGAYRDELDDMRPHLPENFASLPRKQQQEAASAAWKAARDAKLPPLNPDLFNRDALNAALGKAGIVPEGSGLASDYFRLPDGRRLRVADHPSPHMRSQADVYLTYPGPRITSHMADPEKVQKVPRDMALDDLIQAVLAFRK